MDQPNYNLFVLGEVGGRSSLLNRRCTKSRRANGCRPNLCYLHNFGALERPLDHVTEDIALLAGVAAGELNAVGHYLRGSVLGRAQDALLAFRRVCREVPQRAASAFSLG